MAQLRQMKEPEGPSTPPWAIVLAIVAFIGIAVALGWWLPDVLGSENERVSFVARVVILVTVIAGAAFHWRGRLHIAGLQALAWAGIFVLVIFAYSFRHEFGGARDRVIGELVPHRAIPKTDDTITIRAAADGHFHIDIEADNATIRFMVDTGATTVALSRRHAEKIGFNRHQLRFTQRVSTANGVTMAAPVQIREMRVGPIAVYDVNALVLDNFDGPSLLGMSFLERLGGYEVSNGVLTLRR